MDSDIEEYTLLAAAQFLDEVEWRLEKIGRIDLSLALNKVQQDTGVQLEMASSGVNDPEMLTIDPRDKEILGTLRELGWGGQTHFSGLYVPQDSEFFSSEDVIITNQNFEPVTKDRLSLLFSEIAPLLFETEQKPFLELSNDLGLSLNLTPSSPVLTAPPHPTTP